MVQSNMEFRDTGVVAVLSELLRSVSAWRLPWPLRAALSRGQTCTAYRLCHSRAQSEIPLQGASPCDDAVFQVAVTELLCVCVCLCVLVFLCRVGVSILGLRAVRDATE